MTNHVRQCSLLVRRQALDDLVKLAEQHVPAAPHEVQPGGRARGGEHAGMRHGHVAVLGAVPHLDRDRDIRDVDIHRRANSQKSLAVACAVADGCRRSSRNPARKSSFSRSRRASGSASRVANRCSVCSCRDDPGVPCSTKAAAEPLAPMAW